MMSWKKKKKTINLNPMVSKGLTDDKLKVNFEVNALSLNGKHFMTFLNSLSLRDTALVIGILRQVYRVVSFKKVRFLKKRRKKQYLPTY